MIAEKSCQIKQVGSWEQIKLRLNKNLLKGKSSGSEYGSTSASLKQKYTYKASDPKDVLLVR